MDFAEQLRELRLTDPVLADRVVGLKNLESILAWIPTVGLSLASVDLVQQDEYNYDFLVPLEDGQRCLSFGLT